MIGCTNRTDLCACGIAAMIAQFCNKKTFYYFFIQHPVLFETTLPAFRRIDMDIFILIYFISFYPCTEIAVRHLVFHGASPDTGATPDASGCINDKGPVEVF